MTIKDGFENVDNGSLSVTNAGFFLANNSAAINFEINQLMSLIDQVKVSLKGQAKKNSIII